MKVLVIGGTLFIGRALVRAAQAQGHDVTILHRTPGHPFQDVEELLADRNDASQVRAAVAGRTFDYVFDNAYDWSRGTSAMDVQATARTFGSLSKYLFMSSVAAFGSGVDLADDAPLAADSHPDFYVRNKASSERALFAMYRADGFPALTLRPPFVYGPDNPYYREAYFWDHISHSRPIIIPDTGERLMQFIYVHDLAKACLFAAASDLLGCGINATDGTCISQEQVVQALADTADRPYQVAHFPRAFLRERGGNPMGPNLYFGEYLDLDPITMRAQRLAGLGWQATPMAKALAETYEWYQRQQKRAYSYEWEEDLLMSLR